MNTQDQLDRLLVKIKKIAAAGAQREWDLGNLLLPIFNKELWTARKDKKGNQLYRQFWVFVGEEIGITYSQARHAMQIASRFERSDLQGVSAAVAFKASNVRDPATRCALVVSGAALFGVKQRVDALPASALFSATHRSKGIGNRSIFEFERLLWKRGGKLTIRVLDNDAFAVTYTTKTGATRIAHADRLADVLDEALRTATASAKSQRAVA